MSSPIGVAVCLTVAITIQVIVSALMSVGVAAVIIIAGTIAISVFALCATGVATSQLTFVRVVFIFVVVRVAVSFFTAACTSFLNVSLVIIATGSNPAIPPVIRTITVGLRFICVGLVTSGSASVATSVIAFVVLIIIASVFVPAFVIVMVLVFVITITITVFVCSLPVVIVVGIVPSASTFVVVRVDVPSFASLVVSIATLVFANAASLGTPVFL